MKHGGVSQPASQVNKRYKPAGMAVGIKRPAPWTNNNNSNGPKWWYIGRHNMNAMLDQEGMKVIISYGCQLHSPLLLLGIGQSVTS